MPGWPMYGRIDGPIVMIGFGSIGRGTLPLLERHFTFDAGRMVVIDPDDSGRKLLDERGIRFVQHALTPDNYRDILTPLLTEGEGQGFCVNLSVDTSSLDIMRLCREARRALHRHGGRAVAGLLLRPQGRQPRRAPTMRCARPCAQEKARNPGGTTAVSCCGANPGMVSWFVKQALVNLAGDTRPRLHRARAGRPRGLGAADARPRRQGRPHRRARHPALDESEADGRLRQHLVGRRLHLGGHAAGRAGLGHAREVDAGERRAWQTIGCEGRRSTCSSPAPTRGSAPGARRRGRSTASSSPTTSRSRSPTISP